MNNQKQQNKIERPPVVVIMGHIDHGKSTLLDYIRKSNVVEKEIGGITQHISAYEVTHKDEHGQDKRITFLDTPGHEAFSRMRERGAKIADIAILIVSAEDGVKPQTIEAWKTIQNSGLPCIVAINKIDKEGANIEKTKMNLAEHEIYLENFGGKIPFAEISAKTGKGVDDLLLLINIVAELENFTGNTNINAEGFVIEANLDPKRGVQATLVIKNGSLKNGMTVVVEDAICSTRIIENFNGKPIKEAEMSSPIRLVGFDKMPKIGSEFYAFDKKSDALKHIEAWQEEKLAQSRINKNQNSSNDNGIEKSKKIIPIVLKADVSGSLEAIAKEIGKIKSDNAEFKIIHSGEGSISERDIKSVGATDDPIIIGFNVKADENAISLAERQAITISFFNIIYKMTEWLTEEMSKRRPRVETQETTGKLKVLKAFSRTKERQILGGKVTEGFLTLDSNIKIVRRDFEIGRGRIVNLEKSKSKTSKVEEGDECGMMIESKLDIVPGDIIESFTLVQK